MVLRFTRSEAEPVAVPGAVTLSDWVAGAVGPQLHRRQGEGPR